MLDPDRNTAPPAPCAAASAKPPRKAGGWARRLIPVVAVIAGIAAFFILGLDRYVTFESLRENRLALTDFVSQQGVFAVLLFIAIYAVATALSLPGGAVLSITGGFLFGAWLGTVYVVLGATTGAIVIFLIAKTSIGDALRARAGTAVRKMEAGFRENALSYLLVLRLIPLFPFFVVNIVPAFLGVSLRVYALATFIGIIPGAFVYVSVGAGLGSVFDSGASFDPRAVITTEVIVALVGLAVLSLLPIAYKKLKARKASG